MLLDLHIESLAVIDKLAAEFSGGLNILTGETGAGKSVIINALKLILGDRASTELIRTGAKKACVEATFTLTSLPNVKSFLESNSLDNPDEPERLILRREITSDGNSRRFINGITVPSTLLKRLGDFLIDLHGQHQHQTLLKKDSQRELLDAVGGMSETIASFRRDYEKLTLMIKGVNAIKENRRENERKKDFYKFQIEEIGKADLKPGEDAEIESALQKLRHAERLKNSATLAYDLLYEGEAAGNPVINCLTEVLKEIETISTLDHEASGFLSEINDIYEKVDSLSASIRSYRDTVVEDPESLSSLEARKDLIYDLKKKYGTTVDDIIEYAEKIKKELDELKHIENEEENLEAEITFLKADLLKRAGDISEKRKSTAKKLEKQMTQFLKDLNLPHANFSINIARFEQKARHEESDKEKKSEPDDTDETPDLENDDAAFALPFRRCGIDDIEFLFSANPGEDMKPLKKVASGGELSRIMLALKSRLASKDQVPTIVFDEIDVGIGGETADRVGRKMAELGKVCQVLCITHLPQIACYSDSHFIVKKTVQKNKTFTTIDKTEPEESKREIARMIDGDNISEISLKHAGEMMMRKNEINGGKNAK